MLFPRNMSSVDRTIRLTFGLMLLFVAATFDLEPMFAFTLAAFGIVNLVSAAISHCPVYRALGLSSCPKPVDVPPPSDLSKPAK